MNLEGAIDYKKMNADELKVLCKERGIEGYSSFKKAELIQVLEGAQ